LVREGYVVELRRSFSFRGKDGMNVPWKLLGKTCGY
jgi:hypothetical protein